MHCPNCGNKLNENASFCGNCGSKINIQQNVEPIVNEQIENKTVEPVNTTVEIQMTESIPVQNQVVEQTPTPISNQMVEPTIKTTNEINNKKERKQINIKDFINKYKLIIIFILAAIIISIVAIVVIGKLNDPTKISWDENYGDYSATHVLPTTIDLKVLAFDKEEQPIENIKFSSNAGEITSNGTEVSWVLPQEAGTYKITAEAPSGKKITKEIQVVENQGLDNSLMIVPNQNQVDENADNDNDGLINKEEINLGTNINLQDTDIDGLSDYYEVNVSKTNPLTTDSDSDGIKDGDELDLGLDPLKLDSKGDGIKDGNRTLSFTVSNEEKGVTIDITGKGNIASATIDVLQNKTFEDKKGLIDKVYNFYTDGTIESAVVKIKYDVNDLINEGLNEDNLTVYYFNETTKELEPINTTVDKENKIITVTLNHFSMYLVGDKNIVLTNNDSEIMFVIDNSVSMYSEKQMIDAGYNDSTGAVGNDTEFKRLSLTNKLIDMFTGNYKFGVAEFSGDYVNLKEFSTDYQSIKTAVSGMESNWKSNGSGTNIVSALNKGIEEFDVNQNNHYLILLTDGKNTEGSLSSNKSSIISKAQEKDVKICVIGLGKNIDTKVLDEIAQTTGCDYYNATDSKALDEIYSLVGADINYNYVDTNNDNKVDGMIIANSGFITSKDGFSFKNFPSDKSEAGVCYGMALFAMLRYTDKLPEKLAALDNTGLYPSYLSYLHLNSNGYNLFYTYFTDDDNNLYDFEFTTEALKMFLGNGTVPGDFRDRIEDDTWKINKKYADAFEKAGFEIIVKEIKNNENYSKYEGIKLTIDNEKFNKGVTKDEAQLINALWRLYILQVDAGRITFRADPDKAYAQLFNELSNGVPAVIGIETDSGSHAINAIRLIQDINDTNKFKIEVYDNNYPGETRYIEVTRKKFNKVQLNYTAWANEYSYKFEYDYDNNGTKDSITVEVSVPVIK